MVQKRYLLTLLILFLFISVAFSQPDKMRIAIMDLQPVGIEPTTAITVSDLLRTEMFKTELFMVIERQEMNTILKEQGFQMSGCTETECAVQMGRLLSAHKVLVGTVNKLGEAFIINARIVDVKKSVMEFGESAKVETESELDIGCKIFAQKLADMIKEKQVIEKKPEVKFKKSSKDLDRVKNENLWEIGGEFGAGELFSLYGSYMKFGISIGFDFGKEEIETKEYSSFLYSVGLFYHLNFIDNKKYILRFRPKIAYSYLTLDKYSTTAYKIAPQFLIGAYNIYGIFSPNYLICKEGNALLFQIGLGYIIKL